MTTKVVHNETVPTLVDVASLTIGTGYALSGGTFMLLTVPVAASATANPAAGSALNIDTDAVVSIDAGTQVEVVDLTITVTNHTA